MQTKARYTMGTLRNIEAFGREVKQRRAREADRLGMTVLEKGHYILSGDLPARFQDKEDQDNDRTRNA